MIRRTHLLWLVCVGLLLMGSGTAPSAEEPAKVPEVATTRPVVREVTDYEDFTGRTEPSKRVELRPRVSGELTKMSFKEGDRIKQGTVLFEIDPRPYQAKLDQALAQVDLHKAALKLAQATLARAQAANKAVPGSVGPEQLDQDRAAVDVAEARIKAAEATALVCKLDLSFCKVTAPMSGQIGRCSVDPGNLVQQDQTLLATLVVQSPVYVYFDVDERTFLQMRRWVRNSKREVDKIPVGVGLADEDGFSQTGVLDLVDSTVDPVTGTLRVRAALANPDGLLVPGMFVRVRLALSAPHKALLISDRAIASDQGLKCVYVLDADNKVQYRRVTVGPLQPDGLRVITDGLKSEDRVVTGRLAGLRPGMTVRPREADAPAPKSPPPEEAPPVRGQAGPGVLVEATYPRAGAEVVSNSVRVPIELEVSRVEKIRYMRSRCTGDGKYTLDVSFATGADLWKAQLLVQNRVSMALPLLPAAVQDAGITVQRGTAGVLLVVNLFAPEGRYDRAFLSNYANIRLKDELERVDGVGEVTLLGGNDLGSRVWLDPDRLAALNLTATDVVNALRKEKRAGDREVTKLEDLIVRADEDGRVIRLRDVAGVELGAGPVRGEALRDGKPVAALVLHLSGGVAPRKVRAAVRDRLAELRTQLPEGLDLDTTFDFTGHLEAPERSTEPEYLLVDLDMPIGARESTSQILKQTDGQLRQIPGVQRVLALSQNPFDLFGGPCLLVQLGPTEARKASREELIRTIRTRLAELKEVTARVRDLSAAGCFPRCGYPIDLALSGPDLAEVREWASRLAERLGQSKKFTDLWVNPDSAPRPKRIVEVNRALAAARGVDVADIFNTIDSYTGALPVNQFVGFGRIWPIEVRSRARSGDRTSDLGKLKVRNAKGQLVPLASFVTVREVEEPLALDFLDLRPMVELTANPASGVSAEAAQKLCATLAEEVRKELGLTAGYRLIWLQSAPRGK
jgi:RND family efflux transporter MFP subunit